MHRIAAVDHLYICIYILAHPPYALYVCTPFIYLYTPSSVYLYTLCISVDHTFHVAHSRGEKCADPGGSGQIDPDCGLPAVGGGGDLPLLHLASIQVDPPPHTHTHTLSYTTLLHLAGGGGLVLLPVIVPLTLNTITW